MFCRLIVLFKFLNYLIVVKKVNKYINYESSFIMVYFDPVDFHAEIRRVLTEYIHFYKTLGRKGTLPPTVMGMPGGHSRTKRIL